MNWILNNNKSRQLLKKNEIKKLIIKSLLYNEYNNFDYKFYFDKIIKKFKYQSSISKIQTYCIFLENKRSIFKKFKLSRHTIKKYIGEGYLIGLKKASF